MIELHQGDYRVQLANCTPDHVLVDPPYGGRTHKGHDAGRPQINKVTGQGTNRVLTYAPWTADDVRTFVDFWAQRTAGWIAAFTSHDLIGAYTEAYAVNGRYAFAPVTVIQKRPRLLGDGPSSWTLYLMVSRPKSRHWQKWRCLPGSYNAKTERGAPIVGAKTVALMEELIRDYSNAGDVVCDPCAGWGSTAVAAARLGRSAIVCERDPEVFAAMQKRLTGELAA